MSWLNYYRLLQKYNGDLTKATPDEMDNAYRANPNTPDRARDIAETKWKEKELAIQSALAPDLID